MSLIENIKNRPGPKPIQPLQADAVLAKLKYAEAELTALESQHGAAALEAVVGGSDTALAALNRDIAKARETVATLRAAHTAAVERDEATVRAQRAALQKTQINAVRKHLEARDAAAVALEATIKEAVKQYHEMLDRGVKAQSACPLGMPWPMGSLCEPDPIAKMVTYELYRVSASPGDEDRRAFPGSISPNADFTWNPEAIPAIASEIKQASAHVLASLTGKTTE